MLIGGFARELETQEGLADAVLNGLTHDLPDDHLDAYVEKVSAVTVKDVRRAARKYILPDGAVIAVVWDAGKIGGRLNKFSRCPVRRVDHNGDVK